MYRVRSTVICNPERLAGSSSGSSPLSGVLLPPAANANEVCLFLVVATLLQSPQQFNWILWLIRCAVYLYGPGCIPSRPAMFTSAVRLDLAVVIRAEFCSRQK